MSEGKRHLNFGTYLRAAGGTVHTVGYTLVEQLEQASILFNSTITDVYVDLGYGGVDQQSPDVSIKHRGRDKRMNDKERKLLKLRQTTEPIIGHLKADHRMNRCYLKGA